MYCKNCNNELKNCVKICPICHTQLETSEIQGLFSKEEEEKMIFSNISSYIDNYIQSKTTYVTANHFLKGSKPLRVWWIVVGIIGIILIPIWGLFSISAFFVVMFMCIFKLMQLNKKKYQCPYMIDIENLALFLQKNLSYLSFSQWRCGTPTSLKNADRNLNVIECVFQNKTQHRIVFEHKKNYYKIITHSKTNTCSIAYNFQTNCAHLYKSAYQVHPILEAAILYYLTNYNNNSFLYPTTNTESIGNRPNTI